MEVAALADVSDGAAADEITPCHLLGLELFGFMGTAK
jgi:hypothetical protein